MLGSQYTVEYRGGKVSESDYKLKVFRGRFDDKDGLCQIIVTDWNKKGFF